MKKTLSVALVTSLMCAGLAWAGAPKWWKGSLTVENRSEYDIHHIYLAPAHKPNWGKDWLGKDVLSPGEQLIITGLSCTEYDIKIVDEEGDPCTIEDVDFCQEDLHWEITNSELQNCTGWSK